MIDVTPDWKKVPETKSKRVYTRRGSMVACAVCGVEVYRGPSYIGRRYCSRSCANRARGSKEKTFPCPVCGTVFTTKNRKSCSTACRNELVRRSKLGARNPTYSGAGEDKARWRTARQNACEICHGTDRLHQHHVVYAQTVEDHGGDLFDPRNSKTLCRSCHLGHHTAIDDGKVPVWLLSRDNWLFAIELFGSFAFDYFLKHYTAGIEPTAATTISYLEEAGRPTDDLERYLPREDPRRERIGKWGPY